MAGLRERLAYCAALTALGAAAGFGVSATGERAAQPTRVTSAYRARPAAACRPARGSMPRCAELELGVAPIVDCGAGVPIPVTVDGIEVFEDPGLHGCDKASLQIGDCMPGSSLQRYEGRDADGTPRPDDAVWLSFCRHDGRDDVVNFDMPDSVQLIGYNYESGATCFFESGDNRPWTHVDENKPPARRASRARRSEIRRGPTRCRASSA